MEGEASATEKILKKIKLVMVGDCRTGKTCSLITYATNTFPSEYIPTVLDNCDTGVIVDEQHFTLSLWDVVGSPRDDDMDQKLRPLSYPQTDVIVINFSLDKPETLQHIQSKWVPEINYHCRNVPFIVVGNKLDLRDDPVLVEKLNQKNQKFVTYDEGLAMANSVGAVGYLECSAFTQKGLKQVYDAAVRASFSERKEEKKKEHCVTQ
jgi:Ras-related C3 botulinum toxin substrate 1